MKISPFKIEEYFAKHEFTVPFMMGSSDPESHTMSELISMADDECLLLWDSLSFGYTETHGLPLLREEIQSNYTCLEKDNILVFSGAEEAIFVAMQVILKPNDHVVVLTPCYQSLKEIPKSIGTKVTEVPLEWKNKKWSFNLENFVSAMSNNAKLVVVNFPHNPTGFQPTKELFLEIVAIAEKYNAYLFCDEVYRLSEQHSDDCLPNAADCYSKAISLGVMSKSFGLPGLRIGWIATHDKLLLKNFASYKNYTTISNSAPSEILALIALRRKELILQRNRDIAKANLDLLDNFFKQYEHVYEWYRPSAGFINFPKLKLNIAINDYAEKLIRDEGVMVIPGTIFDNFNNHFRLGFGRRNLPEALIRFERFTENIIL